MQNGDQFGHWTVVETIPGKRALCECACGTTKWQRKDTLSNGTSKSCGCTNRVEHPVNKMPEYNIWAHAKARCCNPKHQQYRNYGARGITMCAEWKNSFASFLADVGKRPDGHLSLDRIDNNRGYEPGNVRWTTHQQQMSNKRTNHQVTFNGRTQTVSAWARELSIPKGTLLNRLNRQKWPIEMALSPRH